MKKSLFFQNIERFKKLEADLYRNYWFEDVQIILTHFHGEEQATAIVHFEDGACHDFSVALEQSDLDIVKWHEASLKTLENRVISHLNSEGNTCKAEDIEYIGFFIGDFPFHILSAKCRILIDGKRHNIFLDESGLTNLFCLTD
jgi:hypothetical protein